MREDMNEVELQKYIGGMIREYRKKKRLSQGDLGKRIGVGDTTISAYERGLINLNLNTLFSIADTLEIKVDDLFPNRKANKSYLDQVKEMGIGDFETKDALFLQKLIEKAASMEQDEREKFMESIRFTVEYFEKMR